LSKVVPTFRILVNHKSPVIVLGVATAPSMAKLCGTFDALRFTPDDGKGVSVFFRDKWIAKIQHRLEILVLQIKYYDFKVE
jgi:hypothetical protein